MKFHTRRQLEDVDLDLAPMLALMVTLIPILLLSSRFVEVGTLGSQLPQLVASSESNDEPQFTLSVFLNDDLSVKVSEKKGQSEVSNEVKALDNQIDVVALQKHLLSIKKQHPEHISMALKAAPNIDYQSLVKIIDAARVNQLTTETFDFVDPETGQKQKTKLMFPKIVFEDLFSGVN